MSIQSIISGVNMNGQTNEIDKPRQVEDQGLSEAAMQNSATAENTASGKPGPAILYLEPMTSTGPTDFTAMDWLKHDSHYTAINEINVISRRASGTSLPDQENDCMITGEIDKGIPGSIGTPASTQSPDCSTVNMIDMYTTSGSMADDDVPILQDQSSKDLEFSATLEASCKLPRNASARGDTLGKLIRNQFLSKH